MGSSSDEGREERMAMGEHRLDEMWAVITGGSKGIGLGIAAAFVRHGAHVVLVARTKDDLDAAQSQLRSEAGESQHVETRVADIGDESSVMSCSADLAEAKPGLSTIVANAGTGSSTNLLNLTVDKRDRIMRDHPPRRRSSSCSPRRSP